MKYKIKQKLILIVATDNADAIGKNNDLLFHLPADMKFFKEKTIESGIVVMGRKTWESIPEKYRPFKNRLNFVLSKKKNTDEALSIFGGSDDVFKSIDEFMQYIAENQNDLSGFDSIMVIGGGEIYKAFLDADLIDEMYITQVDTTVVHADTFLSLPLAKRMTNWVSELVYHHQKDNKHTHQFRIRHYTKNND